VHICLSVCPSICLYACVHICMHSCIRIYVCQLKIRRVFGDSRHARLYIYASLTYLLLLCVSHRPNTPGFVTFADAAEAIRALHLPYKSIDGREAECSLAAVGKEARLQREREMERTGQVYSRSPMATPPQHPHGSHYGAGQIHRAPSVYRPSNGPLSHPPSPHLSISGSSSVSSTASPAMTMGGSYPASHGSTPSQSPSSSPSMSTPYYGQPAIYSQPQPTSSSHMYPPPRAPHAHTSDIPPYGGHAQSGSSYSPPNPAAYPPSQTQPSHSIPGAATPSATLPSSSSTSHSIQHLAASTGNIFSFASAMGLGASSDAQRPSGGAPAPAPLPLGIDGFQLLQQLQQMQVCA
jgi:hypothetical protein